MILSPFIFTAISFVLSSDISLFSIDDDSEPFIIATETIVVVVMEIDEVVVVVSVVMPMFDFYGTVL